MAVGEDLMDKSIDALRRDREILLDRIRRSQETIARSEDLLRRIDEMLARAEQSKT